MCFALDGALFFQMYVRSTALGPIGCDRLLIP